MVFNKENYTEEVTADINNDDVVFSEQGLTSKEEEDHVAARFGLPRSSIKRNFVVLVLLDSIFWMGFLDFCLIMQPLLVYLKASNTIIGFITGLRFAAILGVWISPFITRHFRYKRLYLFVAIIPYMAMMAALGLAVIFSQRFGWSNPALLKVVIIISIVQWTLAGFVDLPHQEYVAACIPTEYRGRYSGWSLTIGGVLSIIAAMISKWILKTYPEPFSFGYVLLIAWAIIQFGYMLALLGHERPTPVEESPKPWSRDMLKSFLADKAYVRFMILFFITVAIVDSAQGFINIYGFKGLGMAAAAAAIFQIVGSSVKIPTSFITGPLTDKIGAKRVVPFLFIIAAASYIPVILINKPIAVFISVGLCSMYGTARYPGFNVLIYGIPKPQNRAGHYAIQIIATQMAVAVGPIFAGYLCDIMPYRVVFAIIGALSLAMFPFSKYLLSILSDKPGDYT